MLQLCRSERQNTTYPRPAKVDHDTVSRADCPEPVVEVHIPRDVEVLGLQGRAGSVV